MLVIRILQCSLLISLSKVYLGFTTDLLYNKSHLSAVLMDYMERNYILYSDHWIER